MRASYHSSMIVDDPFATNTSLLYLHLGILILFLLQNYSEITIVELPVSINAVIGLPSN